MASPSASEATNWDPMGPNGPAGRALMVLTPENEAAKWAFSQVVDFIKEQQRTQTEDGDGSSDVRSHYAKFMWFSDEQVYDAAVSRYVNNRKAYESSSSSSSNAEEPCPTMIWTGFYLLDTSIETLEPKTGWLLGRLSRKHVSFGQPAIDMVLSTSRASSVARIHAIISFSPETRLATVSLEFGSSAVVNATSLTSRGSVAGCPLARNRIHVGDLMYSLDYTPYCRQPEGQADLSGHVRSIHGNNQPTSEVLQATPTPQTTNVQTIGRYTITGGLTGLGAFGRVRPAVGPDGRKTVAIKTMDARPSRTQDTQRRIDLMASVSRLLRAENQRNVLAMVESIYVPGRQVNEFHVVLEPYIGFTLHEIPKDTHSTYHELILHDCLRGLAFLHSHDIVHTDIKPANIGLVDFHRDDMHRPARLAACARPPWAVILDIDSMQQMPPGRTTIKARPGTNGTVGFHSPEHELSEYDGRTDVWALGVSIYRAVFGALPWSYGPEGNPWREDGKAEARNKFYARHCNAVSKVANHYQSLGEPLCDFIIAAFRFAGSDIAAQRRPRPTSAECIASLLEASEVVQERVEMEARAAADSAAAPRGVTQGGQTKRPAPEAGDAKRMRVRGR